jgi:ParB family chromosome partitioning protein
MAKIQRVSAFKSAIEKIEESKEKHLTQDVLLIDIENPPFHDRTTISESSILGLAENIKQVGLINPIILRKKPNGKFERIAGFRRIEAVKKLGWDRINSIVLDIDEKLALLIMLSENIQREDLNPYDEVLSLLQLIAVNLDLTEDEVKSLLYKIKNYVSGNIKELTEDEIETKEIINQILSKTGKYNFQGFINRLRILNLNHLIIEALRNKEIQYSHAIQLNKIKDEKLLKNLINQVITKKLSKDDLIEIIKNLTQSIDKNSAELFSTITKKLKNINKIHKDKLPLVEAKIKELIILLDS